MAPCRQVLMWSVPSIAVILGIYWLKKKRELAKSDSGGRVRIKTLKEELAEALNDESEAMRASPLRTPGQSIIIRSAPIDIISNGSGSHRSSPMDFTDEDINLEIEKIVKKKSLENEKRMSNNFGKQIVLVSSSVGKSPLITEELTPQKNPSHNLDLKEQNSDIDIFPLTTDMVDENNMTSTEYISDEFEAESSQHNSIILESTESKANTMDDSTVPEAENINTNTIAGTGESNVESSSRFSPEQTRRISERDSANHSPVDPMLASPMCHFSDNHSEGSSDSGKGCSEAASPPPTNLNMIPPDKLLRIHQFLIPHHLVGLLIGKGGSFVKLIKSTTGANVYVKKLPEVMNISMTEKICAIEGTQSAIEAALELIKDKFPKKLLNQISLQEISAELHQRITPIVPDYLQLRLVESVNNDTILTCIVTAGHFFLQQPLHPTFPSLHVLHRLMATTYQNPDVPSMPRPVKVGSICAAPTENNWYRAEVISTSEEDDTSVVKLVDFGGYLTVDNDQLKQIHADFMTLPFQATEALLAFVKPAKNVDWCEEALRIMAGLTAGQMLHAQVVGYNEDMVPLVNLYLTLNPQQVIFLNRELVDRGLAEWEIPPDS